MINKIFYVSFHGINNGIPHGMNKMIIPLFENNENYVSVLFIGYNSGKQSSKSKKIKPIGYGYRLLMKIISVLNLYVFKQKSFVIRHISEIIFDLLFTFYIKEPIVIISSAYLYHAQKRNKKLGGFNIFISGNPDDRDINALLLSEQKKHQVIIEDAYTYKKRLSYISKSLDHFDHIITFSDVTFNSYSKRILNNILSKVIYHIIPDQKTFKEKKITKREKLSFCYISHPFWLKGLPYLLEAWSKIKSDHAELIIGGFITDDIHKFIDTHFFDLENVIYLGWVDDINEFYRTSYVAIIPSLLDAGPTTIGEAMYCGLPVIVSDGCGSSELVKDGINGFIVPSGNSIAIAERISWFVSNPERIETMGKEAAKTIEELAKSDQNKNVADHILKVIKKVEEL